jgi:hypothetical protein
MDQKIVYSKMKNLKSNWSSNSTWIFGCLKFATLVTLLLLMLLWLYFLQTKLLVMERNCLNLQKSDNYFERNKRDSSCDCSPGYPGPPGRPGLPVSPLMSLSF